MPRAPCPRKTNGTQHAYTNVHLLIRTCSDRHVIGLLLYVGVVTLCCAVCCCARSSTTTQYYILVLLYSTDPLTKTLNRVQAASLLRARPKAHFLRLRFLISVPERTIFLAHEHFLARMMAVILCYVLEYHRQPLQRVIASSTGLSSVLHSTPIRAHTKKILSSSYGTALDYWSVTRTFGMQALLLDRAVDAPPSPKATRLRLALDFHFGLSTASASLTPCSSSFSSASVSS